MLLGKRIIAVVPARSGSKGVPDKNMKTLGGKSLIAHAGICLSKLDWLDAAVISTDSPRYADEAQKFGIDAPFLRPSDLAGDKASALATMEHALKASESYYGLTFDILLLVEPTSPMREAEDVFGAAQLLIESEADSVVTVTHISSKYHPLKVLSISDNKLQHYDRSGEQIIARQQLSDLYTRNGVCYALSRQCILDKKRIITEKTMPLVIERTMVNIDEPIDFEWAEFLISRRGNRTKE